MVEPATVVSLLLKGIIVGVVVSAPLGPVGILCIQRTMNKGRWYGFVTGIGATVSDLIYALLTGYCMSFISDLISRYLLVFQLGGSIMLFVFGVWTFISRPRPLKHQLSNQKGTYTHNFVTAFFVTLSNPLIIFLFIGLFARFAPAGYNDLFFEQVWSYFAIVCGAVLWWFLLTTIIHKIRSRFDEKRICVINKIVGTVVMVAAVGGIIMTATGTTLY